MQVKLVETPEYRLGDKGLLVLREIEDSIPSIDTIIFDVDGVLIDVKGSFWHVASQTVQFYFEHILGIPGEAVLLHPEETRLFKMAGRFNNDWNLTEAAVAFYVWKMIVYNAESKESLRSAEPSLEEFTTEVKRRGGGLEKADELISEISSEKMSTDIGKKVDRDLIRRIFKEHYGGIEYCHRLYGFEPEYYRDSGLILKEKLVLDPLNLRKNHITYGIFSGRTPEELGLAIEQLGLDGLLHPEGVIADDGLHPAKPDPWSLIKICQNLNSKSAVYVGDTMDDLVTVESYNRQPNLSKMAFCYCLTGSSDEKTIGVFQGKKVAFIAEDVNVFVRYVVDRTL